MRVNTPFAAVSWGLGTSVGIIAASAGAKKTVTVEIEDVQQEQHGRKSPARNSRTNNPARRGS